MAHLSQTKGFHFVVSVAAFLRIPAQPPADLLVHLDRLTIESPRDRHLLHHTTSSSVISCKQTPIISQMYASTIMYTKA